MGLDIFTVDFKILSEEKSFRSDVSFIHFQNNFSIEKYYSFTDLFQFQKDNKVDFNSLTDDFLYSEIGNVTKEGEVKPVRLNFNDRNIEQENYYKKIEKGDIVQADAGDILISKVRPNLKKYVFIDAENKDYYYTSAFIHLKPKKLNHILYYALRTIFYNNLIAISRQGKGYPTLKEDDFLYLKFDRKYINKLEAKKDTLITQIHAIEQSIKALKAQIEPQQTIINRVFASVFEFDLKKIEAVQQENFFWIDFAKIRNYHSLRFDVKNQKYLNFFNSLIKKFGGYFTLKSIAKNKGEYGANEPAKDGKKGTNIRYIRITDVDNIGNLTDDDWKTAENIDKQYLLKKDDFLFARSGTVGNTFLYDPIKHEKAIYAGYFIKFNLDFINLEKLFFLYYTKSFIYDFWVKGIARIKAQPNINANEYLELKIPSVPLTKQVEVVDKIKVELVRQQNISNDITEQRSKIDQLIMHAVH